MNYEMMGLIAVYLLNTFILVGILWAQNAKYDARFDAANQRIDSLITKTDEKFEKMNEKFERMNEKFDKVNKEIMELIKKL